MQIFSLNELMRKTNFFLFSFICSLRKKMLKQCRTCDRRNPSLICNRCNCKLHCSVKCASLDESHKKYCINKHHIPKQLQCFMKPNMFLKRCEFDSFFTKFENVMFHAPCCENEECKDRFVNYFMNNLLSYEQWNMILLCGFSRNINFSNLMRDDLLEIPSSESLSWFKVLFTTLLHITKSEYVYSLVQNSGLLECCLQFSNICFVSSSNDEDWDWSSCFVDCDYDNPSSVLFSGFEDIHDCSFEFIDVYILTGCYQELDLIIELDHCMKQNGFQKRIYWNKSISFQQTIFHKHPVMITVIYFKEWLANTIPQNNQILDASEIIKSHIMDTSQKIFWKLIEAPLNLMLSEFGTDNFIDNIVLFFGLSHSNTADSITINQVHQDLKDLEQFKTLLTI